MRRKIVYSLIFIFLAGIFVMAVTSVPLLIEIENFIYRVALFILQHRGL